MKANIKKISEITGFSPATVSNALNHKRGVNRDTADTILETARNLGYQTEARTDRIRFVTFRKNGLIIDDSPFFPGVIEGVEQQAKELGYETTFFRLDCQDESFEDQLKSILNDTKSILIILGTEMMEEDYDRFRGYEGNLIILDGWSESMTFDGIMINNTDAASKAMEYLIEKGHRDIGYLRGNFRIKAFQYREYGYYRVLRKYHLDESYAVTIGSRMDSAYEAMKQYLETNPRLPTAYFADNDEVALGAMRALQEKGIRIPDDVSLIGFDDISFGVISRPQLTTVHVYRREMGEIAVRRVLDYVLYKSQKAKTKIQVSTRFIERGSVKDLTKTAGQADSAGKRAV